MRRPASRRGFTLLEVMISMAILAISLVSLLQMHSGAISMHNYSKHVTVASLLARSKMVDIEEHLYAEDWSEFDDRLEGDFDEEGFAGFTWTADIVKPNINLSADQVASMLGQALGLDADQMAGGEEGGGMFSMLGGGIDQMLTGQLGQLTELMEQGVREVRLKIMWKDITGDSDLTVVTHVVKLPGQGAPGGAEDQVRSAAQLLRDRASDPLRTIQGGPLSPGIPRNIFRPARAR